MTANQEVAPKRRHFRVGDHPPRTPKIGARRAWKRALACWRQLRARIAVAPLAYRGKLGYSLSVTVRRAYEQAYGSRTGHFRPAGSEDSCPTAASRLGPQPETETGFWGRAAGERRIALSGPPQAGTAGLDPGRVEVNREQPQGEVLLAHTAG